MAAVVAAVNFSWKYMRLDGKFYFRYNLLLIYKHYNANLIENKNKGKIKFYSYIK